VYDPGQYRKYLASGFDFLYDKVGMYDCLRDVICHRRPAADITRQWQTNDDILAHTLYFLENHDEQRLASDFFAADARKGVPGLIISALLNTNAMMIYAGQELGERGMDEEGFSGRDGRTTIFDYWSLDTIIRGYFDRRRVKKHERELRELYAKVLRMANEENALREGVFYDLMYVNPQLAERQFAFLRKAKDSLFLIVVNFDDTAVQTFVKINRHAFEWLGLPQHHVTAKDLLSEYECQLTLEPEMTVDLHIEANGGMILKMNL
jgi:glycosidase